MRRGRGAPAALVALVAVAVAASALALPSAAGALDSAEVARTADRIALEWADQQRENGLFHDPYSRSTPPGFGPVMIGYGLIRAGLRRGDRGLVVQGFRAVDAETRRPSVVTGVFERFAFARTYNVARLFLARDAAFTSRRAAWERWMRGLGPPFHGPAAVSCIRRTDCFHNQEVMEALADLELLDTGVRSNARGTILANRGRARAAALHTLAVVAPRATTGARSTGPGSRHHLGLLSDSGAFPLAYHALSSLAMAESVRKLGFGAPRQARADVDRVLEGLAAFLGPDGDEAYIGRRQQHAWPLAASIAAAAIGVRLTRLGTPRARRYRTVADRAFARLLRNHPIGRGGIRIVPRDDLDPGNYSRGIDIQNVNYNGLTVFLLDLAADVYGQRRQPGPTRLTADVNGYFFLDSREGRMASVRHGRLWYVVHGHTRLPDLRNDFGLMVLKRRIGERWQDLMAPRPLTAKGTQAAGPVIVRHGKRYLPAVGRSMSVTRGGTVRVRGGFATVQRRSLGRSVIFRYQPVAGGVRTTFRGRRGDVVRLKTFLPAGRIDRLFRGVRDARTEVFTQPRPSKVSIDGGFSNCCDLRLVAVTLHVRLRSDRTVAYVLRARNR